jgi:hypothetical protein
MSARFQAGGCLFFELSIKLRVSTLGTAHPRQRARIRAKRLKSKRTRSYSIQGSEHCKEERKLLWVPSSEDEIRIATSSKQGTVAKDLLPFIPDDEDANKDKFTRLLITPV